MLALLLLQIPEPLPPGPAAQELPTWAWSLVAGTEGLLIVGLGALVVYFLRSFFEKVSSWDDKLSARVTEAIEPVSKKLDDLAGSLQAHTVAEAEYRGKSEAELLSLSDRLERFESGPGPNRRRG